MAGAESNTERENTETRYENTEGGMKASLKAEAPEEWTIEEALQELDDIVEKLESRDISLELGLLKDKVDFFEEVFGIRLVLRRKRRM